jgi:hypothetical protein
MGEQWAKNRRKWTKNGRKNGRKTDRKMDDSEKEWTEKNMRKMKQ